MNPNGSASNSDNTDNDKMLQQPPPPPTATAVEQQMMIRLRNWQGQIPIVLTLAPTSLSSTTIPAPIHALISRHTFLHVGLEHAVRTLHEYAPPSFAAAFYQKRLQVEEPDHLKEGESSNSRKENDDNDAEESAAKTTTDNEESTTKEETVDTSEKPLPPYPVCWFEDERTQQPLKWQYFVGVLFDSLHSNNNDTSSSSPPLPWKIRLHFQSYPTQLLLELDAATGVLTMVERTFKNALKQALVLLHGNNRVALNLSKQSHENIWKAIQTANQYEARYQPIWVQELQPKEDSAVKLIPIRLWMDLSTTPMIQRRWDFDSASRQSLGALFCQWVPHHFEEESDDNNGVVIIRAKEEDSTTWRIAGLTPPLSTPLLDLWRTLSQPDNFLYICIHHGW
jgi:Autophagy protein Apg5